MTSSGYIMNAKLENRKCSRLPVLITDSHHICGRRIIFGANNIAFAAQVISSLLLGNMNVTESIEGPRFHLSPIGTIGLERKQRFFDSEHYFDFNLFRFSFSILRSGNCSLPTISQLYSLSSI